MARFFQPKKKVALNTKHQAISIVRLDHQGAGIGYQNRKPIFIDGALPGEEVLFQLTESRSKFSRGQLIKVLESSPARVEPFCPHYHVCGGCDLQHLQRSEQLVAKQQTLSDLMAKYAGQTLDLAAPIYHDDKGYRRRARLSLRYNKKRHQLDIGFRKKQSQDIVNLDACPLLHQGINRVIPALRDILQESEKPMALGHVELVMADNGLVLTLRHLQPLTEKDRAALIEFAQRYDTTLYLMPETDLLEHVVGERPFYDEIGYPVQFQPNHFIQVNRAVNRDMVQQALNWLDIQDKDRVLDLFCGVGNFSLPLAQKAQEVVGVEGVDGMVVQAKENAQKNKLENIGFYQANLEEDMTLSEWGRLKFDKILLDPARAGAKGMIDQCKNLGATRIVYVSCNPATLARDSQSLSEQGYRLEKLGMLDMFPHTSHLESMALFVKL